MLYRRFHNNTWNKKIRMKIGLLGATGNMGRRVLHYLLEDNHQTKVLVRNPEKLKELKEHESIEIVTGLFCLHPPYISPFFQ